MNPNAETRRLQGIGAFCVVVAIVADVLRSAMRWMCAQVVHYGCAGDCRLHNTGCGYMSGHAAIIGVKCQQRWTYGSSIGASIDSARWRRTFGIRGLESVWRSDLLHNLAAFRDLAIPGATRGHGGKLATRLLVCRRAVPGPHKVRPETPARVLRRSCHGLGLS